MMTMRCLRVLCATLAVWLAGLAAPALGQVPVVLQADTTAANALRLTLTGGGVEAAEQDRQEVVIRFGGGIEPRNVEATVEGSPTWIETIEYGYDSLLIRFVPAVQILIEQSETGLTIFASRPETVEAPTAVTSADPQRVRLDYYRALAEIEAGDIANGRAILVRLLRAAPRNIDVMLLLARAEEEMSRPRRAVALYDRALALDPNLPGAIRDRQRLARQLADTVRIATRYQDVENGETQIITEVDGRLSSDTGMALGFLLENRSMTAGTVTRRDGRVERFEGDRQRASLTLTPPGEGSVSASGSLYASNHEAGAGFDVAVGGGDHRIGLEARWSEPDFNFVEGIVFGGARDRIGATWQWQWGDVYEFSAGSALNRYTLEGDHAGAGAAMTLEARRRLPEHWLLSTIGYRFDAEYILNAQDNPSTGADLLPLSSREGHTLDATVERSFGSYLTARGVAGYTYDRLNGGGPLAQIGVTYEPLADLEINTNLGTSLNESRGTQNQLFYVGLSLRTRF